MMETILQLSRQMAHNNSVSPSPLDMKYSPTESLKLSARDNKRIERRKPNWTEAENVFLLDQFGIHREILTCKATDASTNLKKQEIWRLICQNLNQHNTLVRRTPAEVRRKWKNLVTAAKKEVWEMRHQIHLGGGGAGGGPNGRKISELSQRVLQLHSSGGFSSANPNGLYGTLLSAGLIGHPGGGGGHGGPSSLDKYGSSKYSDVEDKSYIPAHFTPIITLSESNNNHISLMGGGAHSGHSGDGPPSPLSEEEDDESSDSRNATEFMSDSGIYEQEGIDLRVNVSSGGSGNNGRSGSIGGASLPGGGGRSAGGGARGEDDNNSSRAILSRQLTKNRDEVDDDEDGDMDDDDPDVADMSLIRYSNHRTSNNFNSVSVNGPSLPSYLASVGALAGYHHNNNHHRSSGLGGLVTPGVVGGFASSQEGASEARKDSETTEEVLNGDLIDATLKLRNHFIASLKESDLLTNLYKERLELQIEVLKLRKQKLNKELTSKPMRNINGAIHKYRAIGANGLNKKRNNYFRFKPKNTWLNFASRTAKEILHKGTNTEVMVNGNANIVNCKKQAQSDNEDDDEENN